MNNNDRTETRKTSKPAAPDMMFQHSFSSDNPFLFQIFFLAQDQSQDVEVVETEELDFGEITQRLKLGESVFIKHKNPETLESNSRINKEGEHSFWYFTRC